MRSLILAFAVVLLASSCATTGVDAAATGNQASQCKQAGGTLKQVGRAQTWQCSVPYADAGKTCSDKADCAGACVATLSADNLPTGTGTCQTESQALFGCYSLLQDGNPTPLICVD